MFTLAESLGGVESLIEHPALMTHARDRDDGLVWRRRQGLGAAGVDAEGRNEHLRHRDGVRAMVAVELLHERDMLIEIGIEGAVGQGQIRLDLVVAVHDLDVNAALFERCDGLGEYLAVRHGTHADANDVGVMTRSAADEGRGDEGPE